MKIDQLIYFRETARHEHLGRAAQILAVSPSAISHSISALEEELGKSLFLKSGKNIRLTEHGKLLLERSDSLLREFERLRADFSSSFLPLRGNYKIAAAHLVSTLIVSPACFEFQRQHDQITFELVTLKSASALAEVLNGHSDLAFCFNAQEHPDLELRTLSGGRMIPAVRKGHPLLKASPAKVIQELSGLPCVMPKAAEGIQVCERHPVFQEHGIQLNVAAVVDSYELAAEYIRNSAGWGFFPDWVIPNLRVPLAPLSLPKSWNARFTISAVWLKNRPLSQTLIKITEAVEQKLA